MIRQTKTIIQVNKRFIRCLVLFLLISGSNAVAQIPQLAYSKLLVDRATSPTNEFISPTVIRAADHIANPLGTYYMYYAPHDAPGGIYMAYSNSISGPYTAYSGNPIVTNNHQGKFNVSHVSSPHVVWMPQYNKYFMYFHGENTATRWASSTNGVTWDVANDNVALRTADWGSGFTECSYAKVYEYSIPGVGNRYTMVMMLIRSGFGRRIGLATSNDGKKFTPRDQALVSQGPGEGSDIAGPAYWVNNGKHYIVYHGASGNIHYTEVGSSFNLENHLGVFYDPGSGSPELNKAADPFLFYAENKWHMFYAVGLRLEQTIGLAVEGIGGTFSQTIEAENYTSMSGVIKEPCSEGGQNVGSFNTGDWTSYNVNIPTAGTYKVSYRVSSIYTGRTLRLERANGTVQLGTIAIPNTGGWQAWTSIAHNVSLPSGAYSLRIATATGGFNINRFHLTNNLAARSGTEDGIELELISEENGSKFFLFPNPVHEQLYLGGIENAKRVKVYNMQGMEMISVENPGSSISVQSLTKGLHIAVVEKQNNSFAKQKFVKE
jgi:hypothetical protein